MFLSLRKVMSGKSLSARSDDGYRAIPRADIWISPQGRRLSGEEIDNALLVEGYCSKILLFSACGFPDNPPEEPAVHLIVRPEDGHLTGGCHEDTFACRSGKYRVHLSPCARHKGGGR